MSTALQQLSSKAIERGCRRVLAAFENIKPAIWLTHPGICKIAGEVDRYRRRPYKLGWSNPYVKVLLQQGKLVLSKKLHGRCFRFRLAATVEKVRKSADVVSTFMVAKADAGTIHQLSALLGHAPAVIIHFALDAYREEIRRRMREA